MSELGRHLSRMVNKEARQRYPQLARRLGGRSVALSLLPRLPLRAETPYPYKLTTDDAMFPKETAAFGRVIEKSRQDGIQEIHRTIGQQQKEHMWAFVPDASLWIDITQRAEGCSVESDQYLPIFLSYMFGKVESFHTHPDHVVRALAEEEWSYAYSQNYLMEAAHPSSDDLVRCAQMYARSSSDCTLTDNIISHYGVTSYGYNKRQEYGGTFTVPTMPQRIISETALPPAEAIHASIGRLSTCFVAYEPDMSLAPAFTISFEPLPQDKLVA